MDYRAFTNNSLTMMYESIRAALASDDAQKAASQEPRFAVRGTPDGREHAGNLEAERLRRGMIFEIIDWSEDQGGKPAALAVLIHRRPRGDEGGKIVHGFRATAIRQAISRRQSGLLSGALNRVAGNLGTVRSTSIFLSSRPLT
jgi:hypothetical protein